MLSAGGLNFQILTFKILTFQILTFPLCVKCVDETFYSYINLYILLIFILLHLLEIFVE